MTRFVLAFCLARSQRSGKVWRGVHYADVSAPECTGQASGIRGGWGWGWWSGGARVPVQIAGQRTPVRPTPLLAGWQCNKVWPPHPSPSPRDGARPRDLQVPSANLQLSSLFMFRNQVDLLENP